jgi:hypothetical protein
MVGQLQLIDRNSAKPVLARVDAGSDKKVVPRAGDACGITALVGYRD